MIVEQKRLADWHIAINIFHVTEFSLFSAGLINILQQCHDDIKGYLFGLAPSNLIFILTFMLLIVSTIHAQRDELLRTQLAAADTQLDSNSMQAVSYYHFKSIKCWKTSNHPVPVFVSYYEMHPEIQMKDSSELCTTLADG